MFAHVEIYDDREGSHLFSSGKAGNDMKVQPCLFVLGTGSLRPLRGIEIGLYSMKKKEKAIFVLKPEIGFLHEDVNSVPMAEKLLQNGASKNFTLRAEVELLGWKSDDISLLKLENSEEDLVKQIVGDGQGWETPREPFHVSIELEAFEVDVFADSCLGNKLFPIVNAKEIIYCDLGSDTLPDCVQVGVASMRQGEECILFCKEDHAASGILMDSLSSRSDRYIAIRIKLMEFFQVRDLMGDGKSTKRITKKGNGEFPIDCPLDDTKVRLKARIRRRDNTDQGSKWLPLLDSADNDGFIEIETGMAAVPDLVDAAVRLMLPGEISLIHTKFEEMTKQFPLDHLREKLNSQDVEIEIELLGFDEVNNLEVMDPHKKFLKATQFKDQGNILYKANKTQYARIKYNKAMSFIGKGHEFIGTEDDPSSIKVACMLNLAACAQKEKKYGEAIEWCNKVIA